MYFPGRQWFGLFYSVMYPIVPRHCLACGRHWIKVSEMGDNCDVWYNDTKEGCADGTVTEVLFEKVMFQPSPAGSKRASQVLI